MSPRRFVVFVSPSGRLTTRVAWDKTLPPGPWTELARVNIPRRRSMLVTDVVHASYAALLHLHGSRL